MEDSSKYIEKQGHIDITKDPRNEDVITSDDFTIDPTTSHVIPSEEEASMQLLQRGFIIPGSIVKEYNSSDYAQGGPIDVSEIVDDIATDVNGNPIQKDLTDMFKNIGNLYYGKKVFVKSCHKYFYLSKNGIWKELRTFKDQRWIFKKN